MEVSQRLRREIRMRCDDTGKPKKTRLQRSQTIRVHLRGLSQCGEAIRDEARLDVS